MNLKSAFRFRAGHPFDLLFHLQQQTIIIMLFLNNFGLGNLRPYLFTALFSLIFTFGSTFEVQAQVDVTIDVFQIASQGEGFISVNPNPVVNNAQVSHGESVQMQTLTIRSQGGNILAVLDLTQSTNFEVSLPQGLTYWVFQTDSGIISKQILISGS